MATRRARAACRSRASRKAALQPQNGLRANDVIIGIGRSRITNMEQLRAAIKDATAFTVTIRRGNATLVFPVG